MRIYRISILNCSRHENYELFCLVVGGYGLLGVVYSIKLRLAHRQKLERVVEIIETHGLHGRFEDRIREGFLFGDFQYCTDEKSDKFLREGVFSCYRRLAVDRPIPSGQKFLTDGDWKELIYLSHAHKGTAYKRYTEHYLATSGQVYWSDTHQLSPYFEGYHETLDVRLHATHRGSEMITELYVPRDAVTSFMERVRADFLRTQVNVIYGTIRLIEPDEECFLAWAREPWACIIFNLHVDHTPNGIVKSADELRRLIDMAATFDGSFYLTYHRFASLEQLETCHPNLREFLELKKIYDPEERFTSDWYSHLKALYQAPRKKNESAGLAATAPVAAGTPPTPPPQPWTHSGS